MTDTQGPATRSFLNDLDSVAASPLLDPAYRRRKLMFWTIRQAITIGLAMAFWEHVWVRWLFALAVVLALFNLALLFWGGQFLQRRMQRVRDRVLEQEAIMDAEDRASEDAEH
jgi:hypothetical protein